MKRVQNSLLGERVVAGWRRPWRAAGVWVLGCLAAWHSQAQTEAEGLPQRNLLIQWRISGQTQGQQRNQGIQTGQVILDSHGRTIGRSSIGLGTIETESQSDAVQEVRVLNGGRAKLYVGRMQPYSVWQWRWTGAIGPTGSGGLGVIGPQADQGSYRAPQAVVQTVWIDIGQGLDVRPSWEGGKAPVMIALQAQSRQPTQAGMADSGQSDPDGQSRRFEVGSTLSVPMGQWTVVARSGNQERRQQSGTLSTRDLDVNQSQQLEIRVTAP